MARQSAPPIPTPNKTRPSARHSALRDRPSARRAKAVSITLFLAFAVLAAACGPGGDGGDATPAPKEPTAPSDAGAIRTVDPAQVPDVQNLLRQLGGGELDKQSVLYADLTKDGREESIVPISSGGTLGNLAYIVLTMRSGSPAAILTAVRDRSSLGGLVMSLEDGKLVKTTEKYGPEDPLCCPSTLVKTTYYWDGTNLQVEREDEVKQSSPKQ